MFGTIVLLALLLARVVFCIYSLSSEDDSSELLPSSDDDSLDEDDDPDSDEEAGLVTIILAPVVFNFCLFTTSVALSELFLELVADLLPSKS